MSTHASVGMLNTLELTQPRGLGWRIHCGVEVTESSTNKQHTLSPSLPRPTLSSPPLT